MWISIMGTMAAIAANGQTNSWSGTVRSWPTNSYWTVLEINPSIYDTPYRISLFSPQNGEDGARLWSQTKSMFFYGLGVAGFLAALPEEFTGWDQGNDIFENWVSNVKEGPVWDRDEWYINYLGHPYIGGVYYQVARKSGYRQWDSFVYSFMMSTFYWEYGIESFAEVPSVQDLVVHPVLGWVCGEWAYQTELKIRDKNNTVAGSKTLGGISLFFLDPIDSIGRGVNWVAGRRLIKAGSGYFTYTAAPSKEAVGHTVYLNMNFPLGGSSDLYEPDKPSHFESQNDPVDTGIVGFSLGPCYTALDKDWGVENGPCYKVTLGLYFTPRLSSRVSYTRGTLAELETENEVFYENYSLDTQCYFNVKQKLRPFVSAGFGEQMWAEDRNDKYFQWNTGLGLHWKLHSKWALQADWIHYYSPSQSTYDQTMSASLVYRFGQGEHNDW